MTGIVVGLSIALGGASVGWVLATAEALREVKTRHAVERERDHYKKIVEAAEQDVAESALTRAFARPLGAPPALNVVRGGRRG